MKHRRPSGPLELADVGCVLGLEAGALAALSCHVEQLSRWQAKINLVSHASLPDVWRRHVLDSAQLWPILPAQARTLADLGSGAGFPGLVLALLAQAAGRPLATHLIESDRRKAAFLSEAARTCGAAVSVRSERIEAMPPLAADVVTARALAPLERLLPLVARHLAPGGIALLLKGREAERELTAAGKDWHMDIERLPSLSDPSGTILRIAALEPRHAR